MPPITTADDTWLFGWDPTPGIVSVWADRSGRALVWQRDGAQVTCAEDRFRPWLFAASLDDLAHAGAALAEETAPGAERAPAPRRGKAGNSDVRVERKPTSGSGRSSST